MNLTGDNVTTIVVVVFMVLGFLGINSKLKKVVSEVKEHYTEVSTEINSFLTTLSAALDDSTISDDEIKTIIREAQTLGEALKKLKELFKAK
jgi:mevalonate kinase